MNTISHPHGLSQMQNNKTLLFCTNPVQESLQMETNRTTALLKETLPNKQAQADLKLTVIFSKSRCLLWTVSQSLRIFSFTLFISFVVNWSAMDLSSSNSSKRIIRSKLARSRSIFKRSRLRMYIREAVHKARFWGRDKDSKVEQINLCKTPASKDFRGVKSLWTYWMLRCITESFKDLSHFPTSPQVHPETGHGAPRGQTNNTAQGL